MQGTEASVTGVIKFFSKDELKRYLKALVEKYQAENQALGDQLGGLLRTFEQEKAAAKSQPKESKDSKEPKEKDKGKETRALVRGWTRMGNLLVNINDPTGAMTEVLFQLHEDVKVRLAKSGEALKSYEELSSQTIPAAGMYYLQMRNGIPERVIVDLSATHRETFNFNADFKLV